MTGRSLILLASSALMLSAGSIQPALAQRGTVTAASVPPIAFTQRTLRHRHSRYRNARRHNVDVV
jgi:uncharacterized protein YraI